MQKKDSRTFPTMTKPDDIISDGMSLWTVSPRDIKREQPEDKEPARRVAQRTEPVQEEEEIYLMSPCARL